MSGLGNKESDGLGNKVHVEGIGEVDLGLASPRCTVCSGTGRSGSITRGEDITVMVCPCVLNEHARRKAAHQEVARRIVSLKGVARLTQLPLAGLAPTEVQTACVLGAALEGALKDGEK